MPSNRWYVIDPIDGFSTYDTEQEARARAESILDEERSDAQAGGEWCDDIETLEWGLLDCRERATVTHRDPPDEDGVQAVDYGLAVPR